jgi:penicillin-binding protein 2
MQPSQLVRRLRDTRSRVLSGVVLAGFGVIAIGLIRLQVAQHEEFRELSKENHVRLEVLRAPRGSIYDRNGELLADSAPSFNVVYRPFPTESTSSVRLVQGSDWTRRVTSLIQGDTAEVHRLVAEANRTGKSAVLRRNSPFAVRAAVEESRDELPGIDVQIEPLRRYAYGTLAAHLLGYAGEINDQELDSLTTAGYRPGDLIGRSGIERSYEDVLRGEDGAEFVVVNAAGRRVSALTEGPPQLPVAGHDLVLSLDLKVQKALELAMANVERGAAVALDPRDGSVLALVSRPTYDPNEFSVGITVQRWHDLTSGGANPLLNRAIQGVYPPGSTFKIVSMFSALRAGVARPTTTLQPCYGSYMFGSRSFACWKKEGHGTLDFVGAIQHSCDVYFYQIGPKLGLAKLEDGAHAFGLGERTGVDLPQEKKGFVPGTAWYDKKWGAGQWPKGLLLNLTIGQGELLVTPIQLAALVSEAAMSGQPVRPHVVREIRGVGPVKVDKSPRPHLDATDETWKAVHRGLELVVESGTATLAKVQGLKVAGKTGTAQNPHGKDHALFVCYAPADSPTVALAIVVENSGHGGSIAAPKAAEVLTTLFVPDSLRNKPKPRIVVPHDSLHVTPPIAQVPDGD